MEIQDYFNLLDQLAEEYYGFQISPEDFLDQKRATDSSLYELFSFQKDFFGAKEKLAVADYLFEFSKAFENEPFDDREVWIYLSFEINERRDKLHYRLKCASYNLQQPLFKICPDLWDSTLNEDLIDITSVDVIGEGAVLGFKNGFALTDPELNPNILTWAIRHFPLPRCTFAFTPIKYLLIYRFNRFLRRPSFQPTPSGGKI